MNIPVITIIPVIIAGIIFIVGSSILPVVFNLNDKKVVPAIINTNIMAKVYQSNEIKNIALMGGSGSGKTTLMEAMLFECGVIKRRGTIDSQSTVCDYFPVEKEYGYSVFSTVCNIEFFV